MFAVWHTQSRLMMLEKHVRSYGSCRVLRVAHIFIYGTDVVISIPCSVPIPASEKVDEDKRDHQSGGKATCSTAGYGAHVPRFRVPASPVCSPAK